MSIQNYVSVIGLTKNEVIGNAILFLLAGFQTTADSMLFTFYELAHHPDIQEKVTPKQLVLDFKICL